MTEQLKTDPLFIFAQEVIHGAYKPEELKDAAMRAIRHHSAQTAQAVPVLSDEEMEAAIRPFYRDSYSASMAMLNNISEYLAVEQAVRAKIGVAVPMTEQISEGEFAPDAKLLELADKIDHEQNWRHSGIFQSDHLTQDQKDRVLAGVMLRRYADLMAPESWRLLPPKSVVSHSYRAATLEAVVKMAERHGIVGKEQP